MSQLDIFGNNRQDEFQRVITGANHILNGELLFYPNFFNLQESDNFFHLLRVNIEWKQESMKLYGKMVNFPRLTAWYGDSDKSYSFSGITLQPRGWTDELLEIKKRLESVIQVHFNSVLLNLYRSGNDSISWHSDNEKELGRNPIIGSVNFGAKRTFQLRHTQTKEKIDIELTHGSLLIMLGETQHFWQHQVPKTAREVKERINLTFRVLN